MYMYTFAVTYHMHAYIHTLYMYIHNTGQRPSQQQKEQITNYQPIPGSIHQQPLPTGTL